MLGNGPEADPPGPAVDRDLPLDAHLHTDLSPDADVPIDVHCASAVARGIAEIAITDHLDFDPLAPAYAFADFARRERVVREAAEHWAARGVAVRFGVEITYESARDAEIREHLAGHPYDFVIGSIHVRAGSPYARDRVGSWVPGTRFADVVGPYFDEVRHAIRSGLFDTLGHLDVVKKFVGPHLPRAAFEAAPEVYDPILRELAESGTGLEVNSSGLRHWPAETYPPAWAVERYRELGGRVVTTGSDAHRAEHIAYGLATAYRIAAGAGFEEVAIRREPGRVGATGRVAIPRQILATAGGRPNATGRASL